MNGGYKLPDSFSRGSALILTVVLTSILAIVGVIFLLASRVETLSTSSLTDERDLNLAVDTIVTKLSNELVLDTPGVAGQEYYDYPGDRDRWLASIEPYATINLDGTVTYRWGQISDLTGYIRNTWGTADDVTQEVNVDPTDRDFIKEYPEINLDNDGDLEKLLADADGDGIADSKWIELDDAAGSKGQKVYAAIRVIDNCGMLNVNTAYEFDANSTNILRVDGGWLYQINLGAVGRNPDNADAIFSVRSNVGATPPSDSELENYERYGGWKIIDPCEDYTLFDVSDELELRYRYLVSSPAIVRIENIWRDTLPARSEVGPGTGSLYVVTRPYDGNLANWERRVTDPRRTEYDRRHLLTSYSLDRIIAGDANGSPAGSGMININFDPCEYPGDPGRQQLDQVTGDYTELSSWRTARDFYLRCSSLIDPNLERTTRIRMKKELAQLAVNLVDLRDRDTDVTSLCLGNPGIDNTTDFAANDYVYGLEPYPVITRVAVRIDPCDPCDNPNYYAVELFNPFDFPVDNSLLDYSLAVTDINENFDPCDPNTFGASVLQGLVLPFATLPQNGYRVVYNGPNAPPFFSMAPAVGVYFPELKLSDGYRMDRNPIAGWLPKEVNDTFVNPHNITIRRRVEARRDEVTTESRDIFVDRQLIYRNWVRWRADGATRFYGRDFDIEGAYWWDVVYPRAVEDINALIVLGQNNYANDPNPRPAIDIAVPYGSNQNLRTVGDIARIWTVGPTDRLYDPFDADDPNSSELFNPRGLFDVNSIDPNDPNQVNDPNNTRFAGFVEYARTVGEKLLFTSISRAAGYRQDEDFIRLNLADPLYTTLFNYITVFDPRVDGIDNDGDNATDDPDELKVPGRINVNTAPYFLIAQLPWMTDAIAEAIVDYRDLRGRYDSPPDRAGRLEGELRSQLGYQMWRNYMREEPGFASVGELNLVADRTNGDSRSIWKYGIEPGPSIWPFFPDLTPAYGRDDKANDDFEERDLIFARISNLVTVRSDVFTVYMLVRLGADGPQKRVMAILDRSGVYTNTDRVKVLAVHDVSYPK